MILSWFIFVLVRCHVRARAVARVPARVLPDGSFSKIRTYEYVRTFGVVASLQRSIFEDLTLSAFFPSSRAVFPVKLHFAGNIVQLCVRCARTRQRDLHTLFLFLP